MLVNPRVPVETPAVFKALGFTPGQSSDRGAPHPDFAGPTAAGPLVAPLQAARNDLEPPARALQPLIGEALWPAPATEGCRLARMSGSGATVFGLYDDCTAAAAAAERGSGGQRPGLVGQADEPAIVVDPEPAQGPGEDARPSCNGRH